MSFSTGHFGRVACPHGWSRLAMLAGHCSIYRDACIEDGERGGERGLEKRWEQTLSEALSRVVAVLVKKIY